MKANVGPLDRFIRYAVSLAFVTTALLIQLPRGVTVVLSVFAGLLFCSATTRVCPLYCPMGVNTGAEETGDRPL